jgi:hypothetical protein
MAASAESSIVAEKLITHPGYPGSIQQLIKASSSMARMASILVPPAADE